MEHGFWGEENKFKKIRNSLYRENSWFLMLTICFKDFMTKMLIAV